MILHVNITITHHDLWNHQITIVSEERRLNKL